MEQFRSFKGRHTHAARILAAYIALAITSVVMTQSLPAAVPADDLAKQISDTERLIAAMSPNICGAAKPTDPDQEALFNAEKLVLTQAATNLVKLLDVEKLDIEKLSIPATQKAALKKVIEDEQKAIRVPCPALPTSVVDLLPGISQTDTGGRVPGKNVPAQLKLSKTRLHFKDTEVSSKDETQDITLTSTSDSAITNIGAKIVSVDNKTTDKDFEIVKATNSCDTLLHKDDACNLEVQFTPQTADDKSAKLVLSGQENGTDIPEISAALIGTGVSSNIARLEGGSVLRGTPATRAVLGLDLTGASSASTTQKAFLEFNLTAPIGWGSGRLDPLSRRFWVFFNPRFTSVPQTASAISGLNVQTLSGLANQNTNIVQGIDLQGGLEIAILKPRDGIPFWAGYPGTHAKVALSWVVGDGFTTPFSSVDKGSQEFTINSTILKAYGGAASAAANNPPGCVLNGSGPGVTPCQNPHIIAFLNKDRSRFFRKYYTGIRLKTFFFSRTKLLECGTETDKQPCEGVYNLFPGTVDLTVGQDESITGGMLRRPVLRIDAVYPLPFKSGFYIFGSLSSVIGKNISSDPLVLEPPAQTKNLSDPDVFVQTVAPPNRDIYRIGVGVDLIQLFKSNTPPVQNEGAPPTPLAITGTVVDVKDANDLDNKFKQKIVVIKSAGAERTFILKSDTRVFAADGTTGLKLDEIGKETTRKVNPNKTVIIEYSIVGDQYIAKKITLQQ